MAKLLKPHHTKKHAFLSMAQDWRSSGEDRYGLALDNFEEYLARLARFEDEFRIPAGWVPGCEFWVEALDQIVACVRLRFWLSPKLELEGGHIGYDVRPSARSQGFGALALRLILPEAKRRGLQRVRLTVDADNFHSIKIIERSGAVLSGVATSPETDKPIQQYWLDLGAAAPAWNGS